MELERKERGGERNSMEEEAERWEKWREGRDVDVAGTSRGTVLKVLGYRDARRKEVWYGFSRLWLWMLQKKKPRLLLPISLTWAGWVAAISLLRQVSVAFDSVSLLPGKERTNGWGFAFRPCMAASCTCLNSIPHFEVMAAEEMRQIHGGTSWLWVEVCFG